MPPRFLATAVRLGALGAGGYFLLLLAVSVSSREHLLGLGEAKRFCGLYLDCHRMVTVESVRYADTVAGHRAEGRFAIVTVSLSSDATGVTLRSGRLDATLRGTARRTHPRAGMAERALAAAGTPAGLPNVPLPAGAPVRSSLVFDVPADDTGLQLRIRDADVLTTLTELLLIGDEDSFLHTRTWFVLGPPTELAAGTAERRLCGVASGCDTVVRVIGVVQDSQAGPPPRRVPADGVFYLVTLVVTDADSGAPRAVPIDAEVQDGIGRSYGRALDIERNFLRGRGAPGVVRLAFDLPDDVPAPQLVLRKPGLVNRLLGPARIALPGPAPS